MPFFAGTYFPNEPRHGMPSFRDLMQRVHGYLTEHETDIRKQNSSLVNALQSMQQGDPADSLNPLPLDTARQQLEQSFDEREGGFGSAPKFPHPTNIERLLRHWAGASTTAGTTDPACPAHGSFHPGEDGTRRHVRPARRRLLPLLGGRSLDDPALREDAL